MITVSEMLLPVPMTYLGNNVGTCVVCGVYGESHVLTHEIFSKSTGNAASLIRFAGDTLCPRCAEMWRERRKWNRSLFATPTEVLFPLIADNPKSERLTWSEFFKDNVFYDKYVVVLTTDPKKRLWPLAQISYDDAASILVHAPDYGISSVLEMSLMRLKQCLCLIEEIYTAGFSKRAIHEGLWRYAKDFDQVMQFEEFLSRWRGQPEFIPALVIAQKQKE